MFLVFVRQKVTVTENRTLADSLSEIRPPDCSKLAKNPKSSNDVTILQHDVIANFFWRSFVSLAKFSYWSKFHVNIVTGSWIITIFFYKGLTRNPKIGNTPVSVLPNIWRLRQIMDTKFGANVSNKMLLNAANFQDYSFYRFWVIKGQPTGWGGGKITRRPPPPRLGLKTMIETVTYHDVLTNNRVTFFDWFLGRGFHWNVSTWCCEQLLSVNVFFIIFFFRCIIPDFFSMKKFPVPAMFFPLYIPFGGIIELISSLLVSGDGFAIIAVRKFVIDSPTGPNILSLTK